MSRAAGAHSPISAKSILTALLLAVATILYLRVAPLGWSSTTPLLWDASHHDLGALEVGDALRAFDPSALGHAIFSADMYPPGHSLWLGTWYALFGSAPWVWIAAGLAVYLLTTWMLARIHPVGAAIWLATPSKLAIAPSLMVEGVALAWLTASLVMAASCARDPRPRKLAVWTLLGVATLLTKYNVGLPLLVAIPMAAIWDLPRRQWIRILTVAAGIALGGALFLTVQHHGWHMFAEFARNRSNTSQWSTLQRLQAYLSGFVTRDGGVVLVVVFAAAALSTFVRRRSSDAADRFAADVALFFALLSLVALARHPYLLSRNLLAPTTALTVNLAFVARRVDGWFTSAPRRIALAWVPVTTVVILSVAVAHLPRARHTAARYFPKTQRELAPLSDLVGEEVRREPRLYVAGTFNEFSPAWVRILGRRALGTASRVRADGGQPFDRKLEGLGEVWDPRYEQMVASWRQSGHSRVLAITLKPQSPFRTEDYQRRNSWKANETRALESDPVFELRATHTLPEAITVHTFAIGPPGLRFGSGWWGAEDFGRWARSAAARLEYPPSHRPRVLSFELAVDASFPQGQTCRLKIGESEVEIVHLEATPWKWRPVRCLLPPGNDHVVLESEFEGHTPGGRTIRFALRDPWLSPVDPSSRQP